MKSYLNIFKVNGKIYKHHPTHKANSRIVSKDLFKKDFEERTGNKFNPLYARIFATAFNMGYKSAWERDNKIDSDVCLNCGVQLGFRGFCSKSCNKKYARKVREVRKVGGKDDKKVNIYSPREDTYLLQKTLQEQVPDILQANPNLLVLEVGTGSGAILQTLLKVGIKNEFLLGCDINKIAVSICSNQGFQCLQSDLFSNIRGKYDLIVFNPPYLPRDDREPLNSQISTTGGIKGGEIINEFLKQAKNHLSTQGKIILLTSSLTKGINFKGYKKHKINSKKLFFEILNVWELKLNKKN